MANDTTITTDVKDAAEKAPDKQTSVQVDPKLEKAPATDLTAKEAPPPVGADMLRNEISQMQSSL